jgi:hypothetical protein
MNGRDLGFSSGPLSYGELWLNRQIWLGFRTKHTGVVGFRVLDTQGNHGFRSGPLGDGELWLNRQTMARVFRPNAGI